MVSSSEWQLDTGDGGVSAIDEITVDVPSTPSYREGVSFWLWDDDGGFCFPRIGVEATGSTWRDVRETALCMAAPDGRLLLAMSKGAPLFVNGRDGRPRVMGTSELRFECVEPFARWTIEFDGRAVALDGADYLAAGVPKPRVGAGHDEVRLRFHVDSTMVAPPWFQGTRDPEGHHVVGEQRFEQLASVIADVEIDGDSRSFRGGGLRVHRKGGDRNDYGDFHGHTWQSARFPSGRAFGFIHYRPGLDSQPRYREGWVLDAGRVLSARVEDTPWLDDLRLPGEDVSFTLRVGDCEVLIEGTTYASSFRPPRRTDAGTTFPVLHSGIARYRWGNEEAFGMIERSAPIDLAGARLGGP